MQKRKCHNINLVTPTPHLPQIIAALEVAATRGLNLPVVYNYGDYESLTAFRLLDGQLIFICRMFRAKEYPPLHRRLYPNEYHSR